MIKSCLLGNTLPGSTQAENGLVLSGFKRVGVEHGQRVTRECQQELTGWQGDREAENSSRGLCLTAQMEVTGLPELYQCLQGKIQAWAEGNMHADLYFLPIPLRASHL